MAKDVIPGWVKGRQLGSGGQAKVYLCKRESDPDGPDFAVKVLKHDGSEQAYMRFCREIDATKQLDHPNIVKIADHSAPDTAGTRFYVMEYVPEAKTLRKMMEERSNPFKTKW